MRRDTCPDDAGDMKRDPVLIVSALLSALCPLVGNGLYAGPGGPAGTGTGLLSSLRDGPTGAAYAGLGLELLGLTALVVLVAWLVVHLARPAPVAAGVLGVAGSAAVAVKLASAAPVMAAFSLADSLDAATAEVLLGLNDQAFVLTGLLLGIAFAAAGLGLLRAGGSRWVAWWPTVAGGLAVLTAGVGVVRPDSYVPVPFLLLLLWMVALAIRSALGDDREDRAERGIAERTATTTMSA